MVPLQNPTAPAAGAAASWPHCRAVEALPARMHIVLVLTLLPEIQARPNQCGDQGLAGFS